MDAAGGPGRNEREHAGPVLQDLALSSFFRGQPDGPAFIQAVAEQAAGDPDGQHASPLLYASPP